MWTHASLFITLPGTQLTISSCRHRYCQVPDDSPRGQGDHYRPHQGQHCEYTPLSATGDQHIKALLVYCCCCLSSTGRIATLKPRFRADQQPGENQHAFILRRYDTNAISLSTMFRVAFPGASPAEEEREIDWVGLADLSSPTAERS